MRLVKARPGFTLIELLVVIAIIAILIALLVPAVQKVREAAAKTQSSNNMKQLSLASHNYHNDYKMMPAYWTGVYKYSTSGTMTDYSNYSYFFAILPYIEQKPLYDKNIIVSGSTTYKGYPYAPGATVYQTAVPAFFNPNDPTVSDSTMSSYTYTGSWYGSTYSYSSPTPQATVGYQVNSAATSYYYYYYYGASNPPSTYSSITPKKLGASFPDGTSNTVLMAEHYAACASKNTYGAGNYWSTSTPNSWADRGYFSSTFYSPSTYYVPTIEIMPTNCNYSNVQAPRASGILVSMVDGSVRLVTAGISQTIWGYALIPNDQKTPNW